MPLYRWNTDYLETVTSTTFKAEGLQEADLQRLLRDQPNVLEEGLFIVAEEYSNWEDSSRSIDLLGLDVAGQLVVIELKRSLSGDHSELQAVRYAAMVSNMTLQQVIEAQRLYLAKRGINDDARLRILDHLGIAEEADAEIRTERPRIIMASAGFSKELTTSVLWLRDGGLEVNCIELQLYKDGNELLMDATQVIPLPEASDYLVKIRERVEVEKRQRKSSSPERIPGAEAFLDAIDQVREGYRPMLNRLYEWTISLRRENLATLETRRGSWNTSLRPTLPTANVRLAIIYKSGSLASYDLMSDQIRARAPMANARIQEILGPEIYGPNKAPNLKSMPTEELLEALTDAYREANGLPTTPHSGNGPRTSDPADLTA